MSTTVGDHVAASSLFIAAGGGVQGALKRAEGAAQRGAEQTKGLAAAAGRSSYVPREVLQDVPDPGAMAVAIWMSAVTKALS